MKMRLSVTSLLILQPLVCLLSDILDMSGHNEIKIELGFAVFSQCEKTYGGAESDFGLSIKQTSDGGFICGGYSNSGSDAWYHFFISKVDSACNTEWSKIIPGSTDEKGYDVIQTLDGGYLLSGRWWNIALFDWDLLIVKTDESGNVQWSQKSGGSNTDAAYAAVQNPDSSYTVAGFTSSMGAGSYDCYLVKFSPGGNLLWTKTYGGSGKDTPFHISKTSDSGFIIAGYTLSYGAGGKDAWLIKTNSDGDTLWTRTYGGNQDEIGYKVHQTDDGGFIIAGYTTTWGNGGDAYLIRTDSAGNKIWEKNYGGYYQEQANSVKQTSDGNFIFAGFTRSYGEGLNDAWVVKINTNGDTLSTQTYGGAQNDEAESIIETFDGGYALTGYTMSQGAGSEDLYFVKMLPENTLSVYQEIPVDFILTPSPVQNELFLQTNSHKSEIIIYSALGAVCYSEILTHNKTSINVSHFLPGVYFLLMKTNEITSAKQFVKMN